MLTRIATHTLLLSLTALIAIQVTAQPSPDDFDCERLELVPGYLCIDKTVPPVDPVDPEPVDPVTPDPVDPDYFLSRWTVGTDNTSAFEFGPTGPRSGHGVRIYCPVSHFSYDDPIVYPDQPGAAHAHMFWGNTSVDYSTKGAEIRADGQRSTCEGGTNNLSGMWSPVLFTAQGEAVVPEEGLVYYKSFTQVANPIPVGLEMLANKQTNLWGEWYDLEASRDSQYFHLEMVFPTCLAIDPATGEPYLRYQDYGDGRTVNAHVSYAYRGGACPGSHPYSIPRVKFDLRYDLDLVGSDPYIASDRMSPQAASPNLSTIHADYIAGLSQELNEGVLRCIREARDCEFAGNRGQLRERFYNEDGTQIYRNSVRMQADVDRTPFGRDLLPMPNHQH